MIFGTDVNGNVLLIVDGADPSTMPVYLNGAQLTATVLTDSQEAEYLALPENRAGVSFIGSVLTAIPIPAPTPTKIFAQAEIAVQTMLDVYANTWQYDSLLSATSYVTSALPKFQHEAVALIAWRDVVWSSCYASMASIQAGTKTMPASIDAFIATLPSAPARPQ
jgi:hypothetical protein